MEDSRVKQRVVGAIVLVALGIIFIPMILSGGRDNNIPMFGSPIPDKPANLKKIKVIEFENTPQPPEARTEIINPVDKHTDKNDTPVEKPVAQPDPPVDNKKPVASKTTEKTEPVKNTTLTASAWAVQLGSFTRQENATALKDKLRKKGYAAFVEKSTTHNTTSYRVRVGPEVTREDADSLQAKIAQKMNIKGLVVKHP